MKALKTIAFASLAYGGFLVLLYLLQLYFVFWRHEFLPFFGERVPPRVLAEPAAALSPSSLLQLLSGLLFLANGVILLRFINSHSREQARDETLALLLTGEEKTLVACLKRAGGALTQKEISMQTGFSRVKTHRLVTRLKNKGLLSVHAFGMTNKVMLESGGRK